jgi:hypothetical protein
MVIDGPVPILSQRPALQRASEKYTYAPGGDRAIQHHCKFLELWNGEFASIEADNGDP